MDVLGTIISIFLLFAIILLFMINFSIQPILSLKIKNFIKSRNLKYRFKLKFANPFFNLLKIILGGYKVAYYSHEVSDDNDYKIFHAGLNRGLLFLMTLRAWVLNLEKGFIKYGTYIEIENTTGINDDLLCLHLVRDKFNDASKVFDYPFSKCVNDTYFYYRNKVLMDGMTKINQTLKQICNYVNNFVIKIETDKIFVFVDIDYVDYLKMSNLSGREKIQQANMAFNNIMLVIEQIQKISI